MDELDLLKKDWKKREGDYPTLSYNEIYKMIHKKSSSIVKWIFIISIIELIFWSGLSLLVPEKSLEIYDKLDLRTFINISQIIHYIIFIIFIYLFYKNYKSICVADDTSSLMTKIIKTRKTVNYYVYYNIILFILLSLILNLVLFLKPDVFAELINTKKPNTNPSSVFTIYIIFQVIAVIIVSGLLWLYYRIIYGILLRRLNKNYKELESLE